MDVGTHFAQHCPGECCTPATTRVQLRDQLGNAHLASLDHLGDEGSSAVQGAAPSCCVEQRAWKRCAGKPVACHRHGQPRRTFDEDEARGLHAPVRGDQNVGVAGVRRSVAVFVQRCSPGEDCVLAAEHDRGHGTLTRGRVAVAEHHDTRKDALPRPARTASSVDRRIRYAPLPQLGGADDSGPAHSVQVFEAMPPLSPSHGVDDDALAVGGRSGHQAIW